MQDDPQLPGQRVDLPDTPYEFWVNKTAKLLGRPYRALDAAIESVLTSVAQQSASGKNWTIFSGSTLDDGFCKEVAGKLQDAEYTVEPYKGKSLMVRW